MNKELLQDYLQRLEQCNVAELNSIFMQLESDTRWDFNELSIIRQAINRQIINLETQIVNDFRAKIDATTNALKGSERYYTFNIVTYQTDTQYLKPLFSEAKHWLYILHDKDKTDNHIHLLITFKTAKSLQKIWKMLDHEFNMTHGCQNTNIEVNKDIEATIDYYLHDGYDDKASYELTDLHFDNKDYWDTRYLNKRNPQESNDTFIDDLLTKSFRFMCETYGRDFMRNAHRYVRVRELLLLEAKLNEDEKNTIYDYSFDILV